MTGQLKRAHENMAEQTTTVGRSVFLAKLLLITIPLLHCIGAINYVAHGLCQQRGMYQMTAWSLVVTKQHQNVARMYEYVRTLRVRSSTRIIDFLLVL